MRSDGTVTYVGKDMAYQLWKFGLLGKDFHYRAVRLGARQAAVVDDVQSRPRRMPRRRRSAVPSWVCNVIDTRQSYLQKLLKQALAALGYHEQAAHSIHYSYEMVALSHATARELGLRHERRRGPAVRRGVRAQGPRRQGRRPARPADRQGRPGSRQAQRRAAAQTDVRAHRRGDRDRRRPLLHGEVLARQGHRLRHRRGPQLRGRERPVPAVRGRARQQHLQQAAGAARHRRGGRRLRRWPRTPTRS